MCNLKRRERECETVKENENVRYIDAMKETESDTEREREREREKRGKYEEKMK